MSITVRDLVLGLSDEYRINQRRLKIIENQYFIPAPNGEPSKYRINLKNYYEYYNFLFYEHNHNLYLEFLIKKRQNAILNMLEKIKELLNKGEIKVTHTLPGSTDERGKFLILPQSDLYSHDGYSIDTIKEMIDDFIFKSVFVKNIIGLNYEDKDKKMTITTKPQGIVVTTEGTCDCPPVGISYKPLTDTISITSYEEAAYYDQIMSVFNTPIDEEALNTHQLHAINNSEYVDKARMNFSINNLGNTRNTRAFYPVLVDDDSVELDYAKNKKI